MHRINQFRFGAGRSGVKSPQPFDVTLKRCVNLTLRSTLGLGFMQIYDKDFARGRRVCLLDFGVANSNRSSLTGPSRITVEENDKHVAVTRLLHAMIPSRLASV